MKFNFENQGLPFPVILYQKPPKEELQYYSGLICAVLKRNFPLTEDEHQANSAKQNKIKAKRHNQKITDYLILCIISEKDVSHHNEI